MKTLIQIPKKLNFIYILIVITSYIQLGCKPQNSNKERSIIRNMESVFCLESPSINPSINKSGFQNSGDLFFKVKPTHIYKDKWQIDTLETNFLDKHEKDGSIVKEFEFQLSMDTCITVKRLETLLMNIGINNCGLKEKLYWLRELGNARLITVKNNFGDIDGYYVKTKKGEIVPKEYYTLIKTTIYQTGEPCVRFSPERIELGGINSDGNQISMFLKWKYVMDMPTIVPLSEEYIVPNGDKIKMPVEKIDMLFQKDDMFDDNAILISFNDKNTLVKGDKNGVIGLLIYIITKITFLENGYISYLPKYTPFKLTQLKLK